MRGDGNLMSLKQVADQCKVSKGTAGYWVRTGKIRASRRGKGLYVDPGDLARFLRSRGSELPDSIARNDEELAFPSLIPCWEYKQQRAEGAACESCLIRGGALAPCFAVRKQLPATCGTPCHRCGYHREIYLPRLQVVHQMELPTAICHGLQFLAGNAAFAEHLGVSVSDLPGMDVDRFIHKDSLQNVIANMKKLTLKNPDVAKVYEIFFVDRDQVKRLTEVTVHVLKDPPGAVMVVCRLLSKDAESAHDGILPESS